MPNPNQLWRARHRHRIAVSVGVILRRHVGQIPARLRPGSRLCVRVCVCVLRSRAVLVMAVAKMALRAATKCLLKISAS